MQRRPPTRRPFLPPCVPDDVRAAGVYWKSCWELDRKLQKRRRPLSPIVIEKMWRRFRAVMDQLDREWLREQESRLAEIAQVVDRDAREQLLADQRAAAIESNRLDAIETERIGKALVEAYLQADMRLRRRRLKKVGRRIRNQDRAAGLKVAREKLQRLGKPVSRPGSVERWS